MTFFHFFAVLYLIKNTTALTAFKIFECGMQPYTHNEIVCNMSEIEFLIFVLKFLEAAKVQRLNLKYKVESLLKALKFSGAKHKTFISNM